MRRSLWNGVIATLVWVAVAVPAHAQATSPEKPGELKAEVPALADFHEVIYPLWHVAWPNKDVAMMRELLPRIDEKMAALEKAELPGILRDKQAAWNHALAGLKQAVETYRSALAAGGQQASLDAAEELHARFEGMVRLVRPPMPELEAYHVALYRVHHRLMPEGRVAELRTAAGELVERCGVLATAEVPKRFAERKAELGTRIGALCQATAELARLAAGDDRAAIADAEALVHTRYEEVVKLFE